MLKGRVNAEAVELNVGGKCLRTISSASSRASESILPDRSDHTMLLSPESATRDALHDFPAPPRVRPRTGRTSIPSTLWGFPIFDSFDSSFSFCSSWNPAASLDELSRRSMPPADFTPGRRSKTDSLLPNCSFLSQVAEGGRSMLLGDSRMAWSISFSCRRAYTECTIY